MFAYVFNLYDTLLLMTAGLSILLTAAILLKREKNSADKWLLLFLLSQGLYAVHNVMVFSDTIGASFAALFSPYHYAPRILIVGLQGLLLLGYVWSMMDKPISWRHPIFKIGLGLTLLSTASNIMLTAHAQGITPYSAEWIVALLSVGIGSSLLNQLKSYDRGLHQRLSNIDNHSLAWLRIVVIGFVSTWVLQSASIFMLVVFNKHIALYLCLIANLPPLFLMSVMLLYSQTQALNRANKASKLNRANQVKAYQADLDHCFRLNDLMLRVKVYQDPELRLDDLADSIGISPRSLSNLLNRHHGKNFYDFINHYRVLDAQEQLNQPGNKHKTIQRVFEDAGFNSKTTFNTLFKRHTGKTPSEYRRRAAELKTDPTIG